MDRRAFLISSVGAMVSLPERSAAEKPPAHAQKISLVGGVKSHGPAQHDFPNGIPRIKSLMQKAPAFKGIEIAAYPNGFPSDLAELNGSSTLLLYLDGVQTPPPPLLEPGRIAAIQKLMDAGAGLICLHQASTVPTSDTKIPLVEWLGAKRNGMFDRTTEPVSLKPESPSFPVCRGMTPFTYEDEFYPTLIFVKDMQGIVPVLRARVPKEKPADHILAWAYERPNGGRSFGFTGCHYLAAFDQPQIRKMILNAICWTSKGNVPQGGV